ncbi:putative ribonuclease H-like domain-containing protein [Tanacetum coccineum]
MSQPANDEFSQHLSDDEASNHEDASDKNKMCCSLNNNTGGVCEMGAMVMEHYLVYIYNDVWKVIRDWKLQERIQLGKDGVIRILPPVTVAEIQAVEKERKANNILLWPFQEDWDLLHEDLEQIDDLDIEEMDINWQIEMIAIRMKKFYKKTIRRVRVDGKAPVAEKHTKDEEKNHATLGFSSVVRVNHANHFVPRPVQLNAVRQNVNSVRPNVNTGREHPLKNMVDRGIFDSGCSGHMTGNKDQLEDFEEFNGGSVTFGGSKGYISGKGKIRVGNLDFDSVSFVKELGHFNLFSISQICDKQHKVLFTETECLVVSSDFKMPDENQILLKVPRHHNMYSFDMKTPTPAKGFACLIAKATSDESKLWHRRLGHINFKNLNKLVKGNLVRGLPSKVFKNDHTCVACHKGKQHRASCKAKLERLITKPLHTLHMDLFGPTSVRSINHASYCLVITDDCTRFCWVFFLASKDETSGILQTFIRQIENQLSHRVKIIRSDNGTEFKNRDMLEFCGNKGIKQEYSNARTPQQNGVAERMNRTLIEAARTMLADSLLPTTFWAEAVSTACYIFNRVRVTKPQNKTPYELLFGHKPIISYIRPFGCHVTILDTLSVLGKFDGKSDEGFLVGYSLNSKAYRVYNLVTKRVEVNLHVNFLEDKPNVKGVGYRWMFDIDYLTDSMNYIPVSLENQANPHAGTSETTNNAGTSQTPKSNASEEKDEDLELIVAPSTITIPEEIVDSRTSSTKELEQITLKHLGTVPENNSTSTPSVNTGSQTVNTSRLDHDDSPMPELEIFHKIEVSPTPTLGSHNIHPKSQILVKPKKMAEASTRMLVGFKPCKKKELLQFKAIKSVNTALHNYFDAQSVTAVDTSPSRVSQMSKKKKKGDDAPGQKACEIQVVNFDDDIEEMDFADIIEHGYIMIVILKKFCILITKELKRWFLNIYLDSCNIGKGCWPCIAAPKKASQESQSITS